MLQNVRLIAICIAALGIAAAVLGSASASANDETFQMRVVNIAQNDVLHIREQPSTNSKIIGMIPPDARGITFLGLKVDQWAFIRFDDTEGWVPSRFVVAEVAAWSRDEPARTFWNHNGSLMYLRVDGPHREFVYHQPRSGMVEQGARPDSLLFDGEAIGERYVGQARIFNRRCGEFTYQVEGPILEGGRKVVLYGNAPTIDPWCGIKGTISDRLVFDLVPWQ